VKPPVNRRNTAWSRVLAPGKLANTRAPGKLATPEQIAVTASLRQTGLTVQRG